MKDLKKRNVVRTIVFLVPLLLGLAAVAPAQHQGACSASSVAGTWGYTETGTVILAGVPVPYASVGIYTLDAHGNLSGSRTASAGGQISTATIKGKATVNSDCTGTEILNFYDPDSGNLTGAANKNLVYVDNAREVRKIATSATLVIPGSTLTVPTVLTTQAKKLFSNSQNEQ